MYKFVLLVFLFGLMPAMADNGTAALVPVKEVKKAKDPESLLAKDFKQALSQIKVKENGTNDKPITELFDKQKDTLVIMVKPNCIFCESFLKTSAQLKFKPKIKTIVLMDKAHATEEDFKKKMTKHAAFFATWVYDYNNSFHDDLGFASYPRFAIFNSQGVVTADQIGLVIPKNREALKQKPMNEVLVKLTDETINWIKKGGTK